MPGGDEDESIVVVLEEPEGEVIVVSEQGADNKTRTVQEGAECESFVFVP